MGHALFTIVALLVLTAIADELNEIVWLRFRGVGAGHRTLLCPARTVDPTDRLDRQVVGRLSPGRPASLTTAVLGGMIKV